MESQHQRHTFLSDLHTDTGMLVGVSRQVCVCVCVCVCGAAYVDMNTCMEHVQSYYSENRILRDNVYFLVAE